MVRFSLSLKPRTSITSDVSGSVSGSSGVIIHSGDRILDMKANVTLRQRMWLSRMERKSSQYAFKHKYSFQWYSRMLMRE